MRKFSKHKKLAHILTICLILICLFSSLPMTMTYANVGTVTLTVHQHFTVYGTAAPPGSVFTYRLMPITASAPMPDGSGASGFHFTISGTSAADIGPISFTTAGTYVYELRCTTADEAGYTIDRRVYTITIHVRTDLTTVIIVHVGDDVKMSEILFKHSYRGNLGGGGGGEPEDPSVDVDEPGEPEYPGIDVGEPGEPEYPGVDVEEPSDPEYPSIDVEEPSDPEYPGIDTADPSEPDGEIGEPGGYSPQTGDFSNPARWIGLIALSSLLLGFIIFIIRRPKRSRNDSDADGGS